MSLTESTMLELGTIAPDSRSPTLSPARPSAATTSAARRRCWSCSSAPTAPTSSTSKKALAELGATTPASRSPSSPSAATTSSTTPPTARRPEAAGRGLGFNFPYLYDESQTVAHAYKAACTPDFFLFDADFRLVYRGQFDSSRPGNEIPVTGQDLRTASTWPSPASPSPKTSPVHRLQHQVERIRMQLAGDDTLTARQTGCPGPRFWGSGKAHHQPAAIGYSANH